VRRTTALTRAPTTIKTLGILLGILLSSCALAPYDNEECDKTGKCDRHYLSNTFCFHELRRDLNYGLFFVEAGTSLNGGHFEAFLYNLDNRPMSVRVNSIDYYKLSVKDKELLVSEGHSAKLADERFTFDRHGEFWQVRYDLTVNGTADAGRVEMRSEKHNSYFGAVRACRPPGSTEEFLGKVNK
jgi:hypothetical protein